MPVNLRGHHLLCMLTYQSRGYTPAFVENYDKVVKRLNAGETIKIVAGPDEICEPMVDSKSHHCHKPRIVERDRLALQEIGGVLGRELHVGDDLMPGPGMIGRLRKAFAKGEIRSACDSCEWADFCTRIAVKNFRGVVLGMADRDLP
ncbi:MAG: DUF1284 domain-containing protein [Gammaproteobacteria bacterium]|nr:DUF1284 domain-containing protein [Gammaproteobacteria bacterium]